MLLHKMCAFPIFEDSMLKNARPKASFSKQKKILSFRKGTTKILPIIQYKILKYTRCVDCRDFHLSSLN